MQNSIRRLSLKPRQDWTRWWTVQTGCFRSAVDIISFRSHSEDCTESPSRAGPRALVDGTEDCKEA